MNKRGDTQRLILEIAYIVFAIAIGSTILYYINTNTKDIAFQGKIYAEDISATVELMQHLSGDNVKVVYTLPEQFEFNLDDNFVYVDIEDTKIKERYSKNQNINFKFKREGSIIIFEKNEKLS